MKVCKLKPEILQFGSSFWYGNYAIITNRRSVKKVSLDRLYDIREKEVINHGD